MTPDALQVLGCVYLDGFVVDLNRVDSVAVLEYAQLLERFRYFERCLR